LAFFLVLRLATCLLLRGTTLRGFLPRCYFTLLSDFALRSLLT
jgi:hypothetical protein